MRHLLATKFLKHHKRGVSHLHGKGLHHGQRSHHAHTMSVHPSRSASMEGEGRKKIAPLRFKNLRIR